MRLAAYAGTSAVLAAAALLKAFNQRPNFYSATVYLSQSNACILILTNLALVCAVSFIYGLQRLLYGPLRPIETEQLSEKAWYAVLDTLLAMPSLRDDVGGWLLATFVLLLAGKVWSWIGEGRVDILEQQPPANPRLFHARLSTSLFVSVLFNAFMFKYSLGTVMDNPRPGMMVIFTFEFAILAIFSTFTACRYILALLEARIIKLQTKAKVEERKSEIRAERTRLLQEAAEGETPNLPSEDDVDENDVDVPGWEEKRRWLFGLELATDFIKIIVYTVFFTISLTFIGLPMHIMRDVYMTFASFTKRIQDYSNYKKATQDMNTRYPDATAEELSSDNTCIVCRESMVPWAQPNTEAGAPRQLTDEGLRAKKLPCGHILHLRCLKAWLERQQACPTCRRPVIASTPLAGRDAQGNARPDGNAGVPGAGPNDQAAAPNAGNGARPRRPRNRMRWLNMGPVRIGFYNGPANQIPQALQQGQGGAGTGTGNLASAAHSLASATTQAQLRGIELRLLQQAHELNIEQAQLANIRALEAELARLRVQHGSGANTPPHAHGGTQAPQQPVQPFMARGFNAQPQTGFPHQPFLPQAYQVQPQQQPLGQGHAELPPGMTLPEGWSVIPLQRIGGQVPLGAMPPLAQQWPPFGANTAFHYQAGVPQQPNLGFPVNIPSASAAHAVPPAEVAAEQTSAQSPILTDAAPVSIVEPHGRDVAATQSHNDAAAPGPSADTQPAPPEASSSVNVDTAESSGPWNNASWNFEPSAATSAPASDTRQSEDEETEPRAADETNGHVDGLNGPATSSKGKGKAVEVEDAQDSGT